jgi:16S rRNA (guanine1207-N2)-methyltransferase
MIEHYYSVQPTSTPKLGFIRANLCGRTFEFVTAASVFSKKRVDTGTRLLIESMILPDQGTVLDVGCGYGAVGIAAAAFKPALRVVMSDVNVRATRLAQENAERNKVANAEARCGYLYEPVGDSEFNVVLSNPPVSAGMDIVKSIITQAPKIMAPKATLQIVVRSKIGGKTLPAVLEDTFGNSRILARESGYRVLLSEKR